MMSALTSTLTFSRVHLALATDPTVSVTAGTVSRTDTQTSEGQFRQYANGVTRLIAGSGKLRVAAFTLRALTPAEVATVDSMKGKVCIFRDTYGRRIYGSFLETQKLDIPLSGSVGANTQLTDVTVSSFTEVSYTEGS
jgi:hypothetical protein